MAALHAPNKKRKWWALIIGIIVVLVVVLGFVIGGPRIGEQLDGGAEKKEGELGAPEWVELEMIEVLVRSQPAGASVVINGILQEKPTPNVYKMVKGKHNTVGAFAAGQLPAWTIVPPDIQPSAGVELELAAPTEIETGILKITASVPEDVAGSEVWLDGKLVGTLPLLLENIHLGVYHHVFVTSPRKASFVAIIRPREEQNELIVPMMGTGVYLDRSTDFELIVEQKSANALVTVGEDKFTVPGHATFDKGQLVEVHLDLDERESFHQTFHTSPVGSIRVVPWLDWADLGKAKVQFSSPPKRELFVCLKRPGRAICWTDKAGDVKEIPSGQWKLRAFELDRGKRAYAKGSVELDFEANQFHKVQLGLTPELELEASIKDSSPWNPEAAEP
jgi:hypothetical protein